MSVLLHYFKWSLGLAAAETQTTLAERDTLARHATGRRHLAEIGVWHGVTTARLRAAMDPGGVLLAIDPYPVGRLGFSVQQRIAHAEVGRITGGRVEWVRKTGAEAGRDQVGGEPFDFVFVDGDHSYEGLAGDWAAWAPLIAPGGVVALHDSRSSPLRNIDSAGSVRFTREIILQDARFETLDTIDSLTVLGRK